MDNQIASLDTLYLTSSSLRQEFDDGGIKRKKVIPLAAFSYGEYKFSHNPYLLIVTALFLFFAYKVYSPGEWNLTAYYVGIKPEWAAIAFLGVAVYFVYRYFLSRKTVLIFRSTDGSDLRLAVTGKKEEANEFFEKVNVQKSNIILNSNRSVDNNQGAVEDNSETIRATPTDRL